MIRLLCQPQGSAGHRKKVVDLGTHLDESLGIGDAAPDAERSVAGLDPFPGIGATVPLALQTIQSRQFLIHHVGDLDQHVVVDPDPRGPDVAGNGGGAGPEEEDLGRLGRRIPVPRVYRVSEMDGVHDDLSR